MAKTSQMRGRGGYIALRSPYSWIGRHQCYLEKGDNDANQVDDDDIDDKDDHCDNDDNDDDNNHDNHNGNVPM